MADLKALTVYLPPEEVDALDTQAVEAGRSGVSAEIRFQLAQLRRAGGKQFTAADGQRVRDAVREIVEHHQGLGTTLMQDLDARLVVELGLARSG